MARVLIVDDDRGVRRVLRKLFERNGYIAVEAESGGEALAVIRGEQPPDAIVCDVMMPGMSGLEFYERLADEAPSLGRRTVFLSGSSSVAAVHHAIERLGVPLLAKLNDLQLVVDAVRLSLAQAEQG
ncbi:MAG TPA: response regulator [Gemmatimonadales bacterium]|jgi:CheY-like chemotaxis protein|nr:response regulator [Gemmatimonadales bacterium]